MKLEKSNNRKYPLVLLVEDEPVIQVVHSQMLKKIGCEVELAKTGEEAVLKAEGQYDLIFMDIGLPGINGFETTIQIRKQELLDNHTPIIALTAYMQVTPQDCLNAGIDDLWFKPIKFNDLQKLILKYKPRSVTDE